VLAVVVEKHTIMDTKTVRTLHILDEPCHRAFADVVEVGKKSKHLKPPLPPGLRLGGSNAAIRAFRSSSVGETGNLMERWPSGGSVRMTSAPQARIAPAVDSWLAVRVAFPNPASDTVGIKLG
jgi:hypothetical protein